VSDLPESAREGQRYSRVRDCAAAGCDRHTRDGGDALLERISPKGGPFVGLCQDHYGSAVLKPEAAAVLDADRPPVSPAELYRAQNGPDGPQVICDSDEPGIVMAMTGRQQDAEEIATALNENARLRAEVERLRAETLRQGKRITAQDALLVASEENAGRLREANGEARRHLERLESDLSSLYWNAEGEGPQEPPEHLTGAIEDIRAALAGSPSQETK
jgi:hypothetical protein